MRADGLVALIVLSVALARGAPLPAEPPAAAWRIARTHEGVVAEVVESPEAAWGRAAGEIEAAVDRVLEHLVGFESLVGQIPRLVEARVMGRGDGVAVVYFRFGLPWPFSDRDYTARYRWVHGADGTIAITVEDADAEGPPPAKAVRVRDLRARFLLTPVTADRTRIEYVFHGEFGGHLPRGVKAQIAWKTPFESILGIRKAFKR